MRPNSISTFVLLGSLVLLAGCAADEPNPGWCAVPVGDSPTRGPDDALVTIVEFADFQCPYCAAAESSVQSVDEQRPSQLRWVFKHLPLTSIHPYALDAAVAAECASEQGMFWEMRDALFAHSRDLRGAELLSCAEEIGLDTESWKACLSTDAPRERVSTDVELAIEIDVPAAPAFYINGRSLIGAQSADEMLSVIDEAEQEASQSELDAADYYASLEAKGCN
jgi:protein-disulfide isomerase